MTWPAILLWFLILAGVFSKSPLILYVGAIAGAFGTLQMVPGELVGGTNFIPGSVCAVFFALKILSRQKLGALLQAALDPKRLGLLFAFYVWCLFSAFVMPRLFAGKVEVIPIVGQVPWAVPLQPTAANLTQPAYLTISIFLGLAGYFASAHAAFIKHWLQATAVGGLALIATGLLDLVFSGAGLSQLLEPFRNATYGLLTDTDILGAKRVVGLMPEASAYGGACVGTATSLAFLRPCFEPKWRDVIVPATTLGLIGMALLSTSSAAYVGLVAFGAVYAVNWVRRNRSDVAAVRAGLSAEATLVILGVLAFVVVVALQPSLLDPVNAMLDQIIFDKSSSQSFEERSMWTRVGLEAFYGTYGLGVGFGGARTSNWFVAELSNTGAIGCIILGTYIIKSYLLKASREDVLNTEMVKALKMTLLPSFIMGLLAGTTPDVPGTFAFGLILGLALPRLKHNPHPTLEARPHINSKYFSAARRQV